MNRGLDIVATTFQYWYEVYNFDREHISNHNIYSDSNLYRVKSPNLEPKITSKDKKSWKRAINIFKANKNLCNNLIGSSNEYLNIIAFSNWFYFHSEPLKIQKRDILEKGFKRIKIHELGDISILDRKIAKIIQRYDESEDMNEFFTWLYNEESTPSSDIDSLDIYMIYKYVFIRLYGEKIISNGIIPRDVLKRGQIIYRVIHPEISQLLDPDKWSSKELESGWFH